MELDQHQISSQFCRWAEMADGHTGTEGLCMIAQGIRNLDANDPEDAAKLVGGAKLMRLICRNIIDDYSYDEDDYDDEE